MGLAGGSTRAAAASRNADGRFKPFGRLKSTTFSTGLASENGTQDMNGEEVALGQLPRHRCSVEAYCLGTVDRGVVVAGRGCVAVGADGADGGGAATPEDVL
jgi:hypothetical protein